MAADLGVGSAGAVSKTDHRRARLIGPKYSYPRPCVTRVMIQRCDRARNTCGEPLERPLRARRHCTALQPRRRPSSPTKRSIQRCRVRWAYKYRISRHASACCEISQQELTRKRPGRVSQSRRRHSFHRRGGGTASSLRWTRIS